MNDSSSAVHITAVGSAVAETIARMAELSTTRVFGEPVQVGERVLITAAAFDLAGGFGFGGGDERGGGHERGGGGGGGRGMGRPIAVIEASPDGVRVRDHSESTKRAWRRRIPPSQRS